ncbi:hypothetical protein JTY93_19335 [Pseudomonas hygromyciniae]|uniref:Type III secretion effector protein n=2 Tax=Pseudomonas hygromyciniae TaxID=2812000 RepID=A0ABX7JST9_9PSED|nr:hypothetical protein [Pseudomonas hygromyciniae]QSB38405.1 hypothetical protein JTY93_19335 [Pseudomonas hygromyciniae]
MWNSGVSAPGNGRMAFVQTVARREPAPIEPVSDVSAVKTLFNQLFEAEQTSKTQTARDLRDKLNELRQKLGDEKFKEALNKLLQEGDDKFLQFLKRMLDEWFPSDDVAPPSPKGGGGGRGGGGRVNPADFGPTERMSNKPITSGVNHFNYKPDKSNPGKKPDNIWSGFSQGSDGNCVTVSAIKAAMMHFGQKPTDIFKDVKETSTGYDVTMRDGFKLSLSRDEVRQAATHARFNGDDPAMMTDANFLFAASAKRAQMENNDGRAGRSFMAAMSSLNDGEYAREGLDRLGLKGHYRPATDADLRNSKVGTVEYKGHSMAVINGRIELWGERGIQPESGIATVLF